MSHVEFERWKHYEMIEPFGWPETEYHTGSLLAMIYNVNRGKKGRALKPQDFIVDAPKAVKEQIYRMRRQMELARDMAEKTDEEKREMILREVRRSFGINDNRSDHLR